MLVEHVQSVRPSNDLVNDYFVDCNQRQLTPQYYAGQGRETDCGLNVVGNFAMTWLRAAISDSSSIVG
jgi:hypothetical protein